jgi:hypothetical protein
MNSVEWDASYVNEKGSTDSMDSIEVWKTVTVDLHLYQFQARTARNQIAVGSRALRVVLFLENLLTQFRWKSCLSSPGE